MSRLSLFFLPEEAPELSIISQSSFDSRINLNCALSLFLLFDRRIRCFEHAHRLMLLLLKARRCPLLLGLWRMLIGAWRYEGLQVASFFDCFNYQTRVPTDDVRLRWFIFIIGWGAKGFRAVIIWGFIMDVLSDDQRRLEELSRDPRILRGKQLGLLLLLKWVSGSHHSLYLALHLLGDLWRQQFIRFLLPLLALCCRFLS